MESEKKLQAIEEELKLLKGELKQTLSSVRDHLFEMELPAAGSPAVTVAPGGGRTVNTKGKSTPPPESETVDESGDESPEPETEEPVAESYAEEEAFLPDTELPWEEEQQIEYEKIGDELNRSVPKVNQLANLVGWISLAKQELGSEQLPALLELYGISGNLSPELKDIILNLAEITAEKPGGNNMAEVWSNSMLSLHGILTGGDAPLNPVSLQWNGTGEELEPDENEVIKAGEEPKEPPVKLKLVFPNGDDKGKEYCIDLAPEVNTGNSKN